MKVKKYKRVKYMMIKILEKMSKYNKRFVENIGSYQKKAKQNEFSKAIQEMSKEQIKKKKRIKKTNMRQQKEENIKRLLRKLKGKTR